MITKLAAKHNCSEKEWRRREDIKKGRKRRRNIKCRKMKRIKLNIKKKVEATKKEKKEKITRGGGRTIEQ